MMVRLPLQLNMSNQLRKKESGLFQKMFAVDPQS